SNKNCLNFQEDLKGLLFDGSNLENEDYDLFGFVSSLENPKDVLKYSRNFKDEGNSSFKKGDFDGALEKYSLSCVFVSCLALQEEETRTSFSQLASSVVLNMVASMLKKKEFKNVGQLCSIVLDHHPNNVKALFRRANAAIGLGKYELACWDLRVAHEVEPLNQEVVRKLKEVDQVLYSISDNNHEQGKEKHEECGPMESIEVSMKIEKDFNQHEGENITCRGFANCKMMEVDRSDGRANVKEIELVGGNPETIEVIMAKEENEGEVGKKGIAIEKKLEKANYHFQNRKKPESTLVISRRDYQLLARGRTVQQYNPRSGIAMIIRVISTLQETSKNINENHSQQNSQSSPVHQGEPIHHKVVAKSVTHAVADQSERSLLREISLPGYENVKIDQPTEVVPMLTDCSQYATLLDRGPCFHSGATGNRSLSSHSIITANRSLSRRARNQGPMKSGMKDRRINRRNPAQVFSNHVFQCRSKIEASVKHSYCPPLNRHNLSNYRSGMKRKFVCFQSPDLP
ncbi:Peptidyl-prolyl cis-trans isomerase FKBP62, partial [Bienertia sinuspersici]